MTIRVIVHADQGEYVDAVFRIEALEPALIVEARRIPAVGGAIKSTTVLS